MNVYVFVNSGVVYKGKAFLLAKEPTIVLLDQKNNTF